MKFFSFTNLLALALSLGGTTYANTPLSEDFVNNSLANNRGFDVAMAARPLWHFGKRDNRDPCYPSSALNNGQQHGTEPPAWPDAIGACRSPGIPAGSPQFSDPFPNYFTVNKCGEDEMRVVYSIYYEHDGHGIGGGGHMHDWERAIVIWRRENGEWRRSGLHLSYHAGYIYTPWNEIQNTFDFSNRGEQGGKDKDAAKIYAGWSKHANFDTRNTGWNDPASQRCEREFRSNDWHYMADEANLLAAGADTEVGETLRGFDWGKADSPPLVMESRICDALPGLPSGNKC